MEETLEVLSAFMEVALTGPRDRVTIRWQPNSSSPLPGVAWWGGGVPASSPSLRALQKQMGTAPRCSSLGKVRGFGGTHSGCTPGPFRLAMDSGCLMGSEESPSEL